MGRKNRAPRPRKQPEAPTYWHGGAPGLSPGTLLLPSDQLGVSQTLIPGLEDLPGLDGLEYDQSKVYFATRRELALWRAGVWFTGSTVGGGTVYRVKPVGPLTADPDFPESYMAPLARILAVDETNVIMSPLELNVAMSWSLFYQDGSPLYSADGWGLAERAVLDGPNTSERLQQANREIAELERRWWLKRGARLDITVEPPALSELLAASAAAEPWQRGPAVRGSSDTGPVSREDAPR